MEIKLDVKESFKLIYNNCPRCHRTFNSKSRKKTEHHAIPKSLKPKTNITVTLCDECHKELNSLYKSTTTKKIKEEVKPNNFNELKHKYNTLRNQFNQKSINRGQFGECLWDNLLSYLKELDKRVGDKSK